MMSCLSGCVLLPLLAAFPIPNDTNRFPTEIDAPIFMFGRSSSQTTPDVVRITTRDQLTKEIEKNQPIKKGDRNDFFQDSNVVSVDFSKYMVVVFYRGFASSYASRITLVDATESDDEIRIRLLGAYPQIGVGSEEDNDALEQVNRAWGIMVLPRSTKRIRIIGGSMGREDSEKIEWERRPWGILESTSSTKK